MLGTLKLTSDDPSEQHWGDRNQILPYDSREVAAIVNLLERSWFERLWIWQEIWLAGPSAVLVCGKNSILWSTFRTAFLGLHFKHLPSGSKEIPLHHRTLLYKICRMSDYRYFPSLLQDMQFSKCTDPRDRIFALLSLLPPTDAAREIEPDYSKGISDVYKDVFLNYCKRRKV
jgi:hypothetical protein